MRKGMKLSNIVRKILKVGMSCFCMIGVLVLSPNVYAEKKMPHRDIAAGHAENKAIHKMMDQRNAANKRSVNEIKSTMRDAQDLLDNKVSAGSKEKKPPVPRQELVDPKVKAHKAARKANNALIMRAGKQHHDLTHTPHGRRPGMN